MANAIKVADTANPKLAGAYITAMMVQKTGLVSGFATHSNYPKCGVALASLANDFIAAQVRAPETFGESAPMAVPGAATNRHQPGQCAFKTSGQLVHSIPIRPGVRS